MRLKPIKIVFADGTHLDISAVERVARPVADFPATVIILKNGVEIMSQCVSVWWEKVE